MAASVNASANPFVGGAQQRNLAPPGVGGAIGSASTRVSTPAAGVAPTQIKSARPNQGSNIGIPYTRLVPLNTSNKLFLKNEYGKMEWRTETEDLRATTLAFILGVRGTNNAQGRRIVDGSEVAPGYHGYNVAYQPQIMPGMPGTERFQQLCSLEYLQMYFSQVLSGKTIRLDANLQATIDGFDVSTRATGPMGALDAAKTYAESALVGAGERGNPSFDDTTDTLLKVADIAQRNGLPGSDAASADDNYQGIFARDYGPFLKGKGGVTRMVRCTSGGNPQKYNEGDTPAARANTVVAQPFSVSRNAGDELAFAVLEAKMTQAGFTDWRPDGIVLSKGVNDPSDKLSDEYLEARDGMLYNIRVQGPAIGTSWTGDRSMETLPLDKVFVVLIADVWFNDVDNTAEAAANNPDDKQDDPESADPTNPKKPLKQVSKYELKRRTALRAGLNEVDFSGKQKLAFEGRVTEKTVLCNFRVQVSTSSQMINHSNFSTKGNSNATQGDSKRQRLEGLSRMGLKLCNEFGEYVVGGWQIGQVLDTSASRAAMPSGSLIGVRTAPNSAALNVNVNISWYSADRLARSFNNPEGTVRTRFDGRRNGPTNPVNVQGSIDEYTAAKRAEAEEAAKKAAAAAAAAAP